jgi:hypothetical protein
MRSRSPVFSSVLMAGFQRFVRQPLPIHSGKTFHQHVARVERVPRRTLAMKFLFSFLYLSRVERV